LGKLAKELFLKTFDQPSRLSNFWRYFVSVRKPFSQRDRSLRIFTLEINGTPTLVFEAMGFAEACEVCLGAELRLDLSALTSDGVAIYEEGATLAPRPAVQAEIAAFERAVELAPTSDEPTMAFLIKIDGMVVVAVDPE
jgi:hypothetical protein